MMDKDQQRELQRIEYEGFMLVEYELPSGVPYGPRTYKKWEIFRIEADKSCTFIGYEGSEHFAKLVADLYNGKLAIKPPPPDWRP